MGRIKIDSDPRFDIMTPEEVAQFLHKSPSWVYKNWQLLGGVKLRGSLFFPSKGKVRFRGMRMNSKRS